MNMCINHQAIGRVEFGPENVQMQAHAQGYVPPGPSTATMSLEEALSRVNHDYQPGRDTRTYMRGVSVQTATDYALLDDVLHRAFMQAADGKGKERHATNKAFEDQPMQDLISLYGVGFALGQAAKKAQESQRMDKDAAVRELLGAIVYIAGAIISLEAA